MSMRHNFLATTALASFGAFWVVIPGKAADLPTKAPVFAPNLSSGPAVSGVNFKIDGFGGWADGTGGIPERDHSGGVGGGEASLTVPLGERFGFQVDGLGGSWGGDAFWGAGGHVFWRDPSVGLLGVTGSWTQLDRGPWTFIGRGTGVSVGNVGGEGEYYLNSVTLRAVAGWEGGDVPSGFFTRADARWYAQQDLMLSIGYRYTDRISAAALGGEWLTPTNLFGGRISLFAEGRIGESDYRAVLGGLRIYFGKSPTLIEKHRRDDPGNDLVENLFTVQQFSKTLDQQNKAAENSSGISSIPSDVRLKRDIVLLARLHNGIGLYRYRYVWDDTLYVGVMAQEVMAIVPQAVYLCEDGYMRVDYNRLGLRLTTWDEWHSLSDAPELQAAA
jgi:hypothetical protein